MVLFLDKIPSSYIPDPFPMNMSKNMVPGIPKKVCG